MRAVGDALHAEWTKLRTVASTGWLLLTSLVLTVGASALTADIVKCPGSCTADTTKVSLTGILIGQGTVAVLAVLAMSGEYSNGMIHVTLTAMPRRAIMLVAKAASICGMVLATAIIAVLGSLAAGRLLLPGNGFTSARGLSVVSLHDGPTLRAAVGSVLYLVLIALLSLGIASAVRDSVPAITTVLGLLYVVPVISALILNPHWRRLVQRYTPMNAGLAVQATRGLARLPIGPWEGLGVLAAWAGAAMLAGAILLRLRDA